VQLTVKPLEFRGEMKIFGKFTSPLPVLAVIAVLLAGCSRPPDLIGVANPEIPADSVPDLTRHQIFIATTREASEVTGAFFSSGRAPDVGLASVVVTIPPNHVIAELERPTRLPPDPRTEFTVIDPVVYSADTAFIAEIRRELAKRPVGQRRLLLFVHGYNNTASDAILRMAQFVEDTGFEGVPVLFTWASAASASRYVYDLNSALVARAKIRDVTNILAQTGAESVELFAHSMGSFLTMEGLVDGAQTGRLARRASSINHIVLASPDIDLDLFRTQLGELPPAIREKMFLLVSSDDGALRASRLIAGGVPRVGAADAEELEKLGVTVIDLSQIEDSSSGSHAKFAGSPEVVQLLGQGLNRVGRFGDQNTPGLDQILAGTPIRVFGN
jgi:esterase/lipase superfamily enzyme